MGSVDAVILEYAGCCSWLMNSMPRWHWRERCAESRPRMGSTGVAASSCSSGGVLCRRTRELNWRLNRALVARFKPARGLTWSVSGSPAALPWEEECRGGEEGSLAFPGDAVLRPGVAGDSRDTCSTSAKPPSVMKARSSRKEARWLFSLADSVRGRVVSASEEAWRS